ncbi:MAG: RNA polymerase sigma factor ShbA [Rhodococcus sp. (in: high G+C Gram-positive bacteria)]|uniref:RNA polymerase sigma factor ShbA n=1 Tax=Rhodococcus sp. TaxID=1831 RepID=UPI003BAF9D63
MIELDHNVSSDVRQELERLAPLAAAGDPDAVGEVLRIAHPVVHRYCAGRLESAEHPHTTAEDVTQEVCVALMSALRTYQDQGKTLLSFIFGIASHKVADTRRRANRMFLPTAQTTAAHRTSEPEDGPEHHVLRREMSEDMSRLLGTLPARHRQVLFMRVVAGMSAVQTAHALQTTPGAVRVAQHRALTHLRARIGAARS